MSGPVTWDNLSKAVGDPTLITEEIDARIVTHNADLSAHGQANEAVWEHRMEAILDHIDDSIRTQHIQALAVTAGKIDVVDLAAINADIGAITAGSMAGVTLAIGAGNAIFKATALGIQLGHATFGSAPFRANMAGDFWATSATISGVITSGAGSAYTGDAIAAAYIGNLNAEKITTGTLTLASPGVNLVVSSGELSLNAGADILLKAVPGDYAQVKFIDNADPDQYISMYFNQPDKYLGILPSAVFSGNPTFLVGGVSAPFYNVNFVFSNQFRLQLGSADVVLKIDSSGRVTLPFQPSFGAYMSGVKTLVKNTWDIVEFDAEHFDVGGNFASYKFTAPTTGKYHFAAGVQIDGIALDQVGIIALYKQGAEYARGSRVAVHATQHLGLTVSATIALTTGQYVDVRVYFTGPANRTTESPSVNYFTGFLVG